MMQNLLNYFSYGTAFCVAYAVIILLKPLALRLGLSDTPGGRKSHHGDIPLLGGIGMFVGFAFSLLTLNISLSPYRSLIAITGLLVVTGILDDFHELTPQSRLFIQVFTAFLMVWWGKNILTSLGNLIGFGEVKLGYFAFPLTLLGVVALINAVNMLDGIDGLAGTVSLIELFYLGWLCQQANLMADKQIIGLILCTLLAFLYFNFPFKSKASVFMGDSGSMMLGFLLSWFCIYLSQNGHQAAHPVVFLWIMAIPIFEISSVVIRRLMSGFSPFKADRGHLHYYLVSKNMSTFQATILLSIISAVLGFAGIMADKTHIPENILFFGFLILFLLYFGITFKLLRNFQSNH